MNLSIRESFLGWSQVSDEKKKVLRQASLLLPLLAEDPTLVEVIQEIKFDEPVDLCTLREFPNLDDVYAPDLYIPPRDTLRDFRLSKFPTIHISYQSPEQIRRLRTEILKDMTIYVNTAGIRRFTIHRDTNVVEMSWVLVSELADILQLQPPEKDMPGAYHTTCTWNLKKHPLADLAGRPSIISFHLPHSWAPDYPTLVNFQEQNQVPILELSRGPYSRKYLHDHFEGYIRTLSFPAYEWNFFPDVKFTHHRREILEWMRLPVAERIQRRGEFLTTYFEVYFGTWSRHRDFDTWIEGSGDFALALKYGPEACYSSGLVKTRMNSLRPEEKILPEDATTCSYVGPMVTEVSSETYYPVVRYAVSPQAGLYHATTPTTDTTNSSAVQIGGTFYYLEPDSNIFLKSEKVRVSRTKYSMLCELLHEAMDPEKKEELSAAKRYFENKMIVKLQSNANYRPEEAFDLLLGKIDFAPSFRVNGEYKSQTGEYRAVFYAMEDCLDQVLYRTGRDLGYDLFLFQSMCGCSRAVPEILDLRSRMESLGNLYVME